MVTEWKSLIKNDIWILVDRPLDQKVIGSRTVLSNKYTFEGKIEEKLREKLEWLRKDIHNGLV